MTSGIYCIENKVNNKKYIGQSKNIKERFSQHIRNLNANINHTPVFQNAWNKYGKENFEFRIILILPNIRWILDIFEKIFILMNSSHITKNGYNVSWGGSSSMKNRKHEEQTIIKIKNNASSYWLGKNRSDETKAKISKSKTGTKLSKNHIEKIKHGVRGKKQSHGKTSKYVGVYKRNDNGKFRAEIKFEGIVYKIGSVAYNKRFKELNNTNTEPNIINNN